MKNKENITHLVPNIFCSKKLKNKKKTKFRDMRIIFENMENVILTLSKNCYCYLNLVFFMFYVFFRI